MELVSFYKISKEEWDNFCLNSKSAWFRHASFGMEFYEKARMDKKENVSFGVYSDKKLVAVAPLMFQKIGGTGLNEFSMAGDSLPFPAFSNIGEKEKSKIEKIIFEEIDNLAKERDAARAKFFVDPLTDNILDYRQNHNPLLRFGFHDVSITTNIINIRPGEQEILKRMHRGHMTDITAALRDKNFDIEILDKENISKEDIIFFKDFYFKVAGKRTSSDEMWDYIFDMVKNGNAAILFAKNKSGQRISGMIIFIYKNKAYYAFAATEKEFQRARGIGHILQWETIKYLKNGGCQYYETGWNFYPIISDDVHSVKEINISRFKSHFGGDTYPLFRGEKYYNMKYLKKKREELTDKFVKYFKENATQYG